MESFETMTRRLFPRVRCELPVEFEFVKWNEANTGNLIQPQQVVCYDLSVSGVGVWGSLELSTRQVRKLEEGLAKVRLAIHLPDRNAPAVCFARLVWSKQQASASIDEQPRYGFSFVDIPDDSFKRIKQFVDQSIDSQQQR